uniref:Transposase Tc1-like domain-containing protein n=1 Tax=Acanthochromis polyacanthus TaxID=80966 RepID=A0A3Q1FXY3_9TELE
SSKWPLHLIIAHLQVGSRLSDVARELDVSQSVISRLAARHRTTGSVGDRPRSGAPRVLDRNDNQYLRTYALRHRYATTTQLQACLRKVRGSRVTPLTPRYHRDRLQWAQDHVTWTMQQRSTVLFTDEYEPQFLSRDLFIPVKPCNNVVSIETLQSHAVSSVGRQKTSVIHLS